MLIKKVNIVFKDCIKKADVLIEEGTIKAIAQEIKYNKPDVINAENLHLAPAIIDMHVHTRDPGFTHKEDLHTCALAAAAGGVGTILAMPNTNPVPSNSAVIKDVLKRAKAEKIKILQCGAITKDLAGEELADLKSLKNAGAAAFSDDGRPVANGAIMLAALQKCKELEVPLLSHAEDLDIAKNGVINCGEISKNLKINGIHKSAEESAIAREIALALSIDAPIHFCHVSTKGSVDLIRFAKSKSDKITAETAPHYLILTEDCLKNGDADYKMNPPLRTAEDVEAIKAAIADGTIDAIATDHAPHAPAEKGDLISAPFGVVGLETLFSVCYDVLVGGGIITLERLFELLHYNPAKILKIPKNSIEVGAKADLILFDTDAKITVNPEKFKSKSRNSAFKNMTFNGQITHTIMSGEIIFERGKA